jgi:ABC-type multidrug transport system permease subunit
MKIFDIVIKDLTSSFRSLFLLIFMFGIPLLVTGMFTLMFGGNPTEPELTVPQIRVILLNLDMGDPNLQNSMDQQSDLPITSLGNLIEKTLFTEATTQYYNVDKQTDYASAQTEVNNGTADVAVYFPSDLSTTFTVPGEHNTVEIYYTAENAGKVYGLQSALSSIVDELSIRRIAVDTALAYASEAAGQDKTLQTIVQEVNLSPTTEQNILVNVTTVDEPQQSSLALSMLAPIMGGMMIFFAFFTGTTTAQSILREAESGTLSRLFTTPTSHRTILTGKFLSVLFTVLIQVSVLIVISHYLFNINWGTPLHVLMAITAIVVPAAAFGIFVNTLVKNTKQSGAIFGGLLTVTGMIGMMEVFTGGNSSSTLSKVSLLVPQGWAIHTLKLSMSSETTTALVLPLVIALLWSIVFFLIGIPRFSKRFI